MVTGCQKMGFARHFHTYTRLIAQIHITHTTNRNRSHLGLSLALQNRTSDTTNSSRLGFSPAIQARRMFMRVLFPSSAAVSSAELCSADSLPSRSSARISRINSCTSVLAPHQSKRHNGQRTNQTTKQTLLLLCGLGSGISGHHFTRRSKSARQESLRLVGRGAVMFARLTDDFCQDLSCKPK